MVSCFIGNNCKGKGMFLIVTKNIICYQKEKNKEENVNEIRQIQMKTKKKNKQILNSIP